MHPLLFHIPPSGIIYIRASTFPEVSVSQRIKSRHSYAFLLRHACFAKCVVGFHKVITFLDVNTFSRAISQDEEIYSNPDTFDPERFFNPDGTLNGDKVDYAFGYGRRHVPFAGYILGAHYSHRFCPGKYMARDVVSHDILKMWNLLTSLNSCG